MGGMELQQLLYFRKVAELQHFTRAAEALAVSQPALSRAVAHLEDELGVRLFEREGRSVRLNRYGQIFLGRVERILQEVEAARHEMADLAGTERGTVALAFLHTLGVRLIPDLLRQFRQKHPQIGFHLGQNASEVLLRQLDAGEIDLCLASLVQRKEQPAVEWVDLFSEELYLVVPPDHALAGRGTAALQEVAGSDFISLKPSTGLRKISDELCRQAGFTPHILFEGEEVATIRGLVQTGFGVALLPAPAAPEQLGPEWLHVSTPVCRRTIGLAWRKDRYLSGAARLFRDFVLARFQ
jgi:DNA-binding transcriptional LysR family regulator